MPAQNADLKARLMAEAAATLDKLFAARKAPAEASLADIEQVARAAGQQLAQAVTAELTAESAAELPPWPSCPTCGRKMKNKGQRRRRVVTETGEVEVERPYYHCAACGQGIFPPG
jgi:NADH pyrophosphatase NudC (nudix superfamily)